MNFRIIRETIPLILFTLALLVPAIPIQAATVSGTVVDDAGYALGGVNVVLEGEKNGSSTDLDGNYEIYNVEAGSYKLTASFIGYKTKSLDLIIDDMEEVRLDIVLESDPIALQEVMVKADRAVTGIKVTEPVRTEVVTHEDLSHSTSDGSLLSALDGRTGLNTRPCALCGSAGVGMQGLDPSYTEVNIDGLPLLSGVGSLYGMDGFAVADIDRVDLVKGSGSSSYGAAAMGGAMNLVSASPSESSMMQVNLSGSDTYQHDLGLSMQRNILPDMPVRISVNYASQPERINRNDDRFTDTPTYERLGFSVLGDKLVSGGSVKSRVRFYTENRFAGDVDWTESDRGSAAVYGRDIETKRVEATVKYSSIPTPWGEWSYESAWVNHRQDSWYGSTEFDAEQSKFLNRLTLGRNWRTDHSTIFQGYLNYEDYRDNLALASQTDRLDVIPGAMLQHTWEPNPAWRIDSGIRLENYADDGLIPTLRGSLLYNPSNEWGIGLSGGTGYRQVTIYSLDKAVHAGFDNVIVPAELEPERSLNGTLSLNHRKSMGTWSLMTNLAGFYTSFDKKATLAYGHTTGQTIYSNALDAFSRGVELQTTWRNVRGWKLAAGGTLSDVQYKDASGWHFQEMQNRYTGTFEISKTWYGKDLTGGLRGSFYGPQELPEGRSRDKSPAYAIYDANLSKQFGSLKLGFNINNLTDWVQPDNPFVADASGTGDIVDSAMIYGPLLGRTYKFTIGYVWNASNEN